MPKLMILGLVLMLGGGALLVFNEFKHDEKHGATVLGADLSITTTETKTIPPAVGGTLLGVGAILTVVAAVRKSRS